MASTKTIINSESIDISFQIENLSPLFGITGNSIDSEIFTCATGNETTKWKICVYPRGKTDINKKYVSVFLCSLNSKPISLDFTFTGFKKESSAEKNVLGGYMGTYEHKSAYLTFGDMLGDDDFIVREELFKNSATPSAVVATNKVFQLPDSKINPVFSSNFVLNIHCVLNIKSENESSLEQKNNFNKSLLDTGKFSDITICVGDEKIAAHKIILAEKSLYLRGILENNDSMTKIEIKEVDAETLKGCLNYLYCQNLTNLAENGLKMYEASVFLQIKDLQEMIKNFLNKCITVDNAVEFFLFAGENQWPTLIQNCYKFFNEKLADLSIRREWQNMLRKHPSLITEWVGLLADDLAKYQAPLPGSGSSAAPKPLAASTPMPPANENLTQSEVLVDLAQLFKNKDYSDVKFEVDGETISAHKSILACRSKIFEAMFKHDAKGNIDVVIKINDVDHESFTELLRYIYCGIVMNLENVALNLLTAADKYEILSLKSKCENYLNGNIRLDNALEILVKADLHSCEKLKRNACIFIGRNLKTIINDSTEEWNQFVQNECRCFNETCLIFLNSINSQVPIETILK